MTKGSGPNGRKHYRRYTEHNDGGNYKNSLKNNVRKYDSQGKEKENLEGDTQTRE
jgi:hypothetical protein